MYDPDYPRHCNRLAREDLQAADAGAAERIPRNPPPKGSKRLANGRARDTRA